jgi:hypothetical protein
VDKFAILRRGFPPDIEQDLLAAIFQRHAQLLRLDGNPPL